MQRPERREWKPYFKEGEAGMAGNVEADNVEADNYASLAIDALLQRAGKSRLAGEEGRGSGEEGRKLHFGNGQGGL
ncbi:hypothetical protein PHISP_02541 [Aspergillus sp. HF37]|nr:hypothetical protein PHISP_02541 [Aspergillus sp. HF37]